MKRVLIVAMLALCIAESPAADLPDLGEPEQRSLIPAVVIAAVAIVADQSVKWSCGDPCNHYVHVASGAALSAAVTHYYGERTGWTVGIAYAIGTELYGKFSKGKAVRPQDIATRTLGTGAGIWISKQF